MPRLMTVDQAVEELKKHYPDKQTPGLVEFIEGDQEGESYAFKLHKRLLDEGYAVDLADISFDEGLEPDHDLSGHVGIGPLEDSVPSAFHITIYPINEV